MISCADRGPPVRSRSRRAVSGRLRVPAARLSRPAPLWTNHFMVSLSTDTAPGATPVVMTMCGRDRHEYTIRRWARMWPLGRSWRLAPVSAPPSESQLGVWRLVGMPHHTIGRRASGLRGKNVGGSRRHGSSSIRDWV